MIRILLSTRLGELRWTQADLARKTGIRPNTISDLYHEITDRVSLVRLYCIVLLDVLNNSAISVSFIPSK